MQLSHSCSGKARYIYRDTAYVHVLSMSVLTVSIIHANMVILTC